MLRAPRRRRRARAVAGHRARPGDQRRGLRRQFVRRLRCATRSTRGCAIDPAPPARRRPGTEDLMKRSTDRILTTHTGSLPRAARPVEMLHGAETGAPAGPRGVRRARAHARSARSCGSRSRPASTSSTTASRASPATRPTCKRPAHRLRRAEQRRADAVRTEARLPRVRPRARRSARSTHHAAGLQRPDRWKDFARGPARHRRTSRPRWSGQAGRGRS